MDMLLKSQNIGIQWHFLIFIIVRHMMKVCCMPMPYDSWSFLIYIYYLQCLFAIRSLAKIYLPNPTPNIATFNSLKGENESSAHFMISSDTNICHKCISPLLPLLSWEIYQFVFFSFFIFQSFWDHNYFGVMKSNVETGTMAMLKLTGVLTKVIGYWFVAGNGWIDKGPSTDLSLIVN